MSSTLTVGPVLYIFGGLPGVGKTELSKFLAQTQSAAYLRIDSIEQAMKNTGMSDLYDEGYQVAFALAKDNLKNGVSVVADSTNPVAPSRRAWQDAAHYAQVAYREIEVVCTDLNEHRARIETRKSDILDLALPDWNSVVNREYEPWHSTSVVLDTAGKTPAQSKQELVQLLFGNK